MGDGGGNSGKGSSRSVKEEAWMRRAAVQLAAQLPERHEDAVRVIEYLMDIEIGFLARGRQAEIALVSCSACSILRSKPEAIADVLPR